MTRVEAKDRFWFGYLEDSETGSIVLWDRNDNSVAEDHVKLFHFGRSELVVYRKDVVRRCLKPLQERDYRLLSQVRSEYFGLLRVLDASRSNLNKGHRKNSPFQKSHQFTCYDCGGSGIERDGGFGFFVCRVCMGWGKVQ